MDNNVNVRFGRLLTGHEVTHVQDLGWERLGNGTLIRAAEEGGFEVMITADKNLRHQQNLGGRRLSIVVLDSLFIKWAFIEPLAPKVQAFLDGRPAPGAFVVIGPEG